MSWLHNIPPNKYNGILIGYRVGWSTYNFMDVGLETDRFNITNLKKYWLYSVYVAGRTNGGAGVKYIKEARTDDDGENLMIYFEVSVGKYKSLQRAVRGNFSNARGTFWVFLLSCIASES